jgi:hypothetical protein
MTYRKPLQIGAAVVLAIIMPVLSSAPVTAGPFEEAIIAIYRGDDETAVRLLRPLAEQGDARAQYYWNTLLQRRRSAEGLRRSTEMVLSVCRSGKR